MKNALFVFFAASLVFPVAAFAGAAKTLKVVEKIEIKAPANVVWAKVDDFGDLGEWHPAVKKTEIIEGKDNVKGAVRLLTLQDGGTIKEKLLSYSAKKMTYKYQIIEGVLPVSSYVSSVSVTAGKGGVTTVIWKGTFKRKDTSAHPAAGQDDATALKTIKDVYRSGLDNLKKISEEAAAIQCPQGAAGPCF
ncbi:MAG TPA: SRPBCC family protein [Burkholderiales bacterium]|nr:SRPBCC family protein [Burkholderiales bacterium]